MKLSKNENGLNEPRTKWEPDNEREKKRFLVRRQEDREQERALKDFLRHLKEDGDEREQYS